MFYFKYILFFRMLFLLKKKKKYIYIYIYIYIYTYIYLHLFSTKILSSTAVFNTDSNKIFFLCTKLADSN